MTEFPQEINVLGKTYRITYTSELTQTDISQRTPVWGQVDYQTRTIRVFVGKDEGVRQTADVMETLIHEICEAMMAEVWMLRDAMPNEDKRHSMINDVATILSDTLVRNGLVELPGTVPAVV